MMAKDVMPKLMTWNSTTNEDEIMMPWVYDAAAIVLSINGFFGFVFNTLVIILMFNDVQLWTPINTILFNLVCSDLSVAIFGNPIALIAAIHKQWIFGQRICVVYGFFMSLLGMVSITTLTVLAYERFCIVAFPFSSRQLNTRNAVISVVFIWTYAIILTTPPLFGWGAYVNEAANISCSVNWKSQTDNATSYIVFLFSFGLVVPVSIIVYCYYRILRTMKQSANRLGKPKKSERKVTIMIGIMIGAFLLAWSPYAIIALIKQFGDHIVIGPELSTLPSLFAKTSICYNPIIYVGMNSQFRKSFRRQRSGESIGATTEYTTEINNDKKLIKFRKEKTLKTNTTVKKSKKKNKSVYELTTLPNEMQTINSHLCETSTVQL